MTKEKPRTKTLPKTKEREMRTFFALAFFIFATSLATPSSAAYSEAQVRAKCAEMAKKSAAPSKQQAYADLCVTKFMAKQKK